MQTLVYVTPVVYVMVDGPVCSSYLSSCESFTYSYKCLNVINICDERRKL